MRRLTRFPRAMATWISNSNGIETLCFIMLLVVAVLSAYSIRTAQLAQHNTRVLSTTLALTQRNTQTLNLSLAHTRALDLDNQRIERLLDRRADQQCQRVQTLRDRVNADTETLFQTDITLIRVIAEPSLLQALSPSDRALRIRAVVALKHELKTLRHESRTDCAAARNPHYQPPPSTPLVQSH